MTQKKRMKWVDVSKAFGIFAIYLGHFGTSAGYGYQFVFIYHVPLFFFLSGCMNYYDRETNLLRFLKKKVKSLLIPYGAFATLSIVVYVLRFNPDVDQVVESAKIILLGCIRNDFFAVSLWFLTCLFVVELLFKLLKYLSNVWIICLICLGLYVGSVVVLDPSPIVEPRWAYNFDSALYYIVYYALGYALYPYIAQLLTMDTKKKQIAVIGSGIGTLLYAVGLFFGIDRILLPVEKLPYIGILVPVVRALTMIWLNLIVAKFFESSHSLNMIGRETLYLCGNEYIMEIIISAVAGVFGLELEWSFPIVVYIYSACLLVLGIKLFIPIEKRAVQTVQNVLTKRQ